MNQNIQSLMAIRKMKDTTRALSSAVSFLEIEATRGNLSMASTGLRFAQLMILHEEKENSSANDEERLKVFDDVYKSMRESFGLAH